MLVALALSGCGAPAAAPATPNAPRNAPPHVAAEADARCAVWNRELAFAASVAAHDARAFAELVHPKATFVQGDGAFLRGRDAIAAAWAPLVKGDPVQLWWHPTAVIAEGGEGEPAVALSRGPYLIEDPRPTAKARYRIGTFQSIWVKDADGAWRVLVDGGTPPPVPASDADAEALKRDLHAACPPP